MSKIPKVPSPVTTPIFGSLKPIHYAMPLIPYGDIYRSHYTNPKKLENAKNWFPLKENNDILITSYPKCGHHLTKKICLEIIKTNHNGKYTSNLYKTADMGINTIPWIEYYISQSNKSDIKKRLNLTNNMYPRFWSTHHSFNNIPCKNIKKNNKIITIIRNPKDFIVSACKFYNYVLKQVGYNKTQYQYTIDDMISYFTRGIFI